MNRDQISTNPEALRQIASAVKTYAVCQCDIVSTYLRQMSSLSDSISLQSFQDHLEAIHQISNRLEELRGDSETFALFLEGKADLLEHLK